MTLRPELKWAALGLADVSEATLVSVLEQRGLNFYGCAHVTATESMASALRIAGARAISVIELTDVVVWSAMPGAMRMAVTEYPALEKTGPSESDPFAVDPLKGALRSWRRTLSGKRLGHGLRADNLLRTFLRDDAGDINAANVIRQSIKDFRSALSFLVASNFHPEDFDVTEPTARVAVDAWRHLEANLPEFTNLRRDLWEEPDAMLDPGHDLRIRVDDVLRHVFRSEGRPVQVLHHGFYFYTPQQWALFQLLRSHPDVGQCFIVHDDGVNRAFESWRHYFVERWDMPRVIGVPVDVRRVRSTVLKDALEGRHVDGKSVASSMKIVGFHNSTEFVRHWRVEFANSPKDSPKPLLFAPLPDDVERIIDRMGSTVEGAPVNLANLPVGQFLLAVHECVEIGAGRSVELVLTPGHLIDMASSGFLDAVADGSQPSANVSAIRRALPFFSDLRELGDWVERAEALERLVVGEVSRFGPRLAGQSDEDRIRGAVANELRVAPWCDLTADEARSVARAVKAASDVVREIVGDGLRRTDDYLAWIRKRLERAMAHLDPEDKEAVEQKLYGLQAGLSGEVDEEGIKDVVRIILNREVDGGSDEEGRQGNRGPSDSRVRDVRSLDALGFRRSTVGVHIANLVESVFPAKASPFGWPLSERLLKTDKSRNVSAEILRTRIATAQLGDLYLLWLALDGVEPTAVLTLSWVTKAGNELRNPSSLLTLVSEPKVRSDTVRTLVGGVARGEALKDVPSGVARSFPAVRSFDETAVIVGVAQAARRIERAAFGSAVICQRRFVIQWALGQSASYQGPHQHSMLYGNMIGILARKRRFAELGDGARDARRRLVADLWRHLTDGQRASSRRDARVKEAGVTASWHFIHSFGGRSASTIANYPRGRAVNSTDLAYQTARGEIDPTPMSTLVGDQIDVMIPGPGPNVTFSDCNMCPVSPCCSMRIRKT